MKYTCLLLLYTATWIACKPSVPATQETQATFADTSVTEIMPVPGLTRLWDTEKTLTTSESVLYDKTNDVLYVSCINGVPPVKKDNDGFISRVSTDGKIIDLKWVTGLSAPKGMGLSGNTLYVTDIDRLVAIDITNRKISQTWNVDGASFLNDIHISPKGIVYFTDSDTRTIYALENGKVNTVLAENSLEGLNGVLAVGDTLYLAGYGSGNVYMMDLNTKNIEKIATDIPDGDGIVKYGDDFLVSNWNGQVYHISYAGDVTLLLDSQEAKLNSADIEIIPEKNLLLVPTFFGNTVTAYQLIKN